ncbi:precorrin-6x reductase [Synechococcus sp. PCC 7502]|uniref:cobalt-precorrin-6A reductase n=1 Tax=Synechococcus sp. PCC 7502 TaxID=1173263 RepID=UPI00029F81E1|nr:cobalt-precorrin-6A reductase [Synechococcus sp. PCC 7502]AFY74238.1 precorrin-6x reductase [Synechococcus sp. PCC 7502]
MKVLVLGGTGDAVKLAAKLAHIPELEIISSLAGRTRKPAALVGDVRIGGFGGVAGLIEYLQAQKIDVVIDATHPCAGQISGNGAIACQVTKIPHLILVRPQWQKVKGDRWIEVASVEAAAVILPELGTRFFITSGRQQLEPFLKLAKSHPQVWFLLRSIDPPDLVIPNSEVLLDRGPFSLESERQLLKNYQIEAIVTKNSGGEATAAKLTAARELNIPVVMIQRPPMPDGEKVSEIDEAIAWILKHLRLIN